MKKQLFIHIGAGKTGSSAIQESLALNKDLLLENGTLIPGCRLDVDSQCLGEQIWFFQNGVKGDDFDAVVKRRVSRLGKHMDENNLHTLILSAENLINPEGFHNLFVGLQEEFDVKIVCYIRRQDDYMISAWQQWYLKAFPTFDDYINQMSHRVDWNVALEPWENNFGSENIILRIYEKASLTNNNVVDDFLEACGLNIENWKPLEKAINRSVDEKFNVISNKYRNELFTSIHDNDFYQFLFDCFGENAFKNYKGSTILTLAQRQNLMARYREPNQKILDTYFADTNREFLFEEPSSSDVHSTREVSLNGDMDYMLVGMFGLYKKMNSIPREVNEIKAA